MGKKATLVLILAWVGLPAWARGQAPQPPEDRSALARLAASLKPGTWAVLNKDGDDSGYGLKFTDSGSGARSRRSTTRRSIATRPRPRCSRLTRSAASTT